MIDTGCTAAELVPQAEALGADMFSGFAAAGNIYNEDAEAPIFEIADFGLVCDLFKLIPELEAAPQSH